MSTILYSDLIFGPIHSRRLGISLGINLLPLNRKFCTFDCLYCECGFGNMRGIKRLPKAEDIKKALPEKILTLRKKGIFPNTLTFAGNGEPTLHPQFPEIVDIVTDIRNKMIPEAKISVLSNATQIGRPEIREALLKIDNNIQKLDSAFDTTVCLLNRPWNKHYRVEEIVENMKKFNGRLIVQTMFIRGEYKGKYFDNTNRTEVEAWIRKIQEIRPEGVMIYAVDREPPISTLEKIQADELHAIANHLKAKTGIVAIVAE